MTPLATPLHACALQRHRFNKFAMASGHARGWLPPLIGATALLLAFTKVYWLMWPTVPMQEFLLGLELEGRTAWMASILLMLLLALISAAGFRRRRDAVWGAMG